MLYIDFDGVILDTQELLFDEWNRNPNSLFLTEEDKIKYIQKVNWDYVLNYSDTIQDSIYYLNQMDPTQSFILTKIHSLENEGFSKVRWLREKKVKQSIILVPYGFKKTEMVDAFGNTLIDDCLANLDDWVEDGGNPIFFDIDNDNYDSWHQPNVKLYQKVNDLSKFR